MRNPSYDFTYIDNLIKSFLEGAIDIVSFKDEMDAHEEIYDFLQSIIDEIKRKKEVLFPIPFRIRQDRENYSVLLKLSNTY